MTIKKDAPLELYNLREDPTESHNLADQYPEMVQLFDEAMRRMHQPSECWPLAWWEKWGQLDEAQKFGIFFCNSLTNLYLCKINRAT